MDFSGLTGWPLVAVVLLAILREELSVRRLQRELVAHQVRLERDALVVRRDDPTPAAAVRGALKRRRMDDPPQ